MALTEAEQRELDSLLAESGELDDETRAMIESDRHASEPDLTDKLDPGLPLLPQALAVQPATTHPDGDEAAASEWLAGSPDSKATVIVYEPPVAEVKRKLREQPGLVHALFPNIQLRPEEIDAMDSDSDVYKSASDYLWRESADAAAKAGKTAYRYSRAPWLQPGGPLSTLDTLGMKLGGSVMPALNAATAFIMGVDDTASFGAAKAIGDVALADEGPPERDSKSYERVREALLGPRAEDDAEETYDHPTLGPVPVSWGRPRLEFAGGEQGGVEQAIEEHPVLNTIGQGVGALAPWTAANKLFAAVTRPIAGAIGAGRGIAAKTVGGAAGGAVAGATEQAAREGVDMAAMAAQTGELPTGEELGEAGGRALEAAPMAGAFGAGGELLGRAAEGGANLIRGAKRYDRAPERFEQLGGEIKFGKGPVAPPEVDRTIERARELDVKPVDVAARELAPTVERSVKENIEAVKKDVAARNQEYFASNEGQRLLPVSNVQQEAVRQMRRQYAPSPEGGPLRAIGSPEAAKKTRALFNSEIDSVSLKPVEGAIPISVDEAEVFLSRGKQNELMAGNPAQSAPLALTLKRRGVSEVYVVPRRYTAEQTEVLKERLQKLAADPQNPADREAKKLYQAVLKDRDARPLKGETGGWSRQQREHAELIGKAKGEAELAAPGGNAFGSLVEYGSERAGQLPRAEALRAAAARSDAGRQLNQLRMLDPLQTLRGHAGIGGRSGAATPAAALGLLGSAVGGVPGVAAAAIPIVADAVTLRGAYPLLNALGAPLGALRSGMAGRAAAIGRGEPKTDDERRVRDILMGQ